MLPRQACWLHAAAARRRWGCWRATRHARMQQHTTVASGRAPAAQQQRQTSQDARLRAAQLGLQSLTKADPISMTSSQVRQLERACGHVINSWKGEAERKRADQERKREKRETVLLVWDARACMHVEHPRWRAGHAATDAASATQPAAMPAC